MTLAWFPACGDVPSDAQLDAEVIAAGRTVAEHAHGESQEELRVPAAIKPARPRGMPTFSTSPDQPLLGVPIRESWLWHLTAQDRFEHVTFHLYVNGFAFSTSDGAEASVAVSPFSLVRNCRFQSGECAKLKSFKVSMLEHDPACYFAVQSHDDREAEEERSEWVLGISHAILLVTESILPREPISCDPLPHLPSTRRRLMASYLIYRLSPSSIAVTYCELRAQSEMSASLVLYESDACDVVVKEIVITEFSVCCDVIGINCTCFVVDSHHFATQTPSERKLWLRALSNVKVKIQNREGDPTASEISHYRESIRDQIRHIESTMDGRIAREPLLQRARTSLPAGDSPPPAMDQEVFDYGAAGATGASAPSPNADKNKELSL
eukprot:TRINITY_DN1552_c0_g4_i1.p1 TRINITY_DN1552_c0_g4~~TRINITY_DN1552_c0_g4_i1.p1  ORF type:complete len:381 (-),score=68.51 TRINITY_DN1552_c0_g4_i1:61-1203(-)